MGIEIVERRRAAHPHEVHRAEPRRATVAHEVIDLFRRDTMVRRPLTALPHFFEHKPLAPVIRITPKLHEGIFHFSEGIASASRNPNRFLANALVNEIETLARGMVPDDAIDQWLAVTRAGINAKEELSPEQLGNLPLAGLKAPLAPKLRWMATRLTKEHANKKGALQLADKCTQLASQAKLSLGQFNRLATAFLIIVDANDATNVQRARALFSNQKMGVILADGDGRGTRSDKDAAPSEDEALLPFVTMRAFPVRGLGWVSQPAKEGNNLRGPIYFAAHDDGHDEVFADRDRAGNASPGDPIGELLWWRDKLREARRTHTAMQSAKEALGPHTQAGQALTAGVFSVVHERGAAYSAQSFKNYGIMPDDFHPYDKADRKAAEQVLNEALATTPTIAPSVDAQPAPIEVPVPPLDRKLLGQALATTVNEARFSRSQREKLERLKARVPRDMQVRFPIAENGFYPPLARLKAAENAKTSPERLARLVHDADPDVVQAAIENPSTPLAALVERYGAFARMVARGGSNEKTQFLLAEIVTAIKAQRSR